MDDGIKPQQVSDNNMINNFEIALRMRDFEINQLTQRNNFLMVFQGVLFAGLLQSGGNSKPIVSFMACFVGFIVSLFQVGMASGSKFWQNYWEQKVIDYEGTVRAPEPLELFHGKDDLYKSNVDKIMNKTECSCFVRKLILFKFSVSRIPIYVGIFFSIIWGFLVLCTLRDYPPFSIPSFIVGFQPVL